MNQVLGKGCSFGQLHFKLELPDQSDDIRIRDEIEEILNCEVEIENFEIKTEVPDVPEASEIDKIHDVPLHERLKMSEFILPDIQVTPKLFSIKVEAHEKINNVFNSEMPGTSEEFSNDQFEELQTETAYRFIVDNYQSIKSQFGKWETNIGEKSIMWSYWEDDFARLEKRIIVMSDLRVRIFLRLREISLPGRDSVKNLEDIVQLLKQISKISPSEKADGENRVRAEHNAFGIQRFQLNNQQSHSSLASFKECNSDTLGDVVQPVTLNTDQVQNNIPKMISTQGVSTPDTATYITGLKDFLSQDLDGLSILSSYIQRGILVPRVRENLVHKIIKREEDILFSTRQDDDSLLQFTISTERLQNLTSDIISLFPTETREVYYVPFRIVKADGKSTRIHASGKLYEHFLYRKGVLMEAGVIVRRRPKTMLNSTTATVRQLTSSDESKLDYIRNATDPTSQLFEYWKDTSSLRKHDFEEGSMGIEELFKKYNCLQMQTGAELLKIDFNHLKPDKSDIFFKRWPVIKSRLVELLQGPRMPRKKEYCALVEKLKLVDEQDPIVLYLLPTLIRPKNLGRQGKNTDETDGETPRKKQKRSGKAVRKTKSKASELESQEAFFIVVPTEGCIEAAVKARKEELQKRDLSLQFLPVFVGTLEKIESSYVYIDTNIKYHVQSPMHAVDLAFKLFYALHCEYPSDAAHVWLFIQQVGFCIVDPCDKFSATMNTLKGEIEIVFPVTGKSNN